MRNRRTVAGLVAAILLAMTFVTGLAASASAELPMQHGTVTGTAGTDDDVTHDW